ncbi:MAG: hypothetical protein P4M12_10655 [Gammaproteobacteria bacterium]|nr:hypothetical protein [Gammaproteobacteria bacterium]
MKNKLFTTLLVAVFSFSVIPSVGFAATKISISKALTDCTAAGNKISGKTVQSELKKQTSLIGMAYLNYIYQNDTQNEHFCQSMLLMNSQVPEGTNNPYIHLFDIEMAGKTMPVLEDVQMSFDYSIGRTNPPVNKVQHSVDKIQAALKQS